MNPLISIIVPCYNQAKYLNDAIDSLQAQTFTNWECIIINDGSTDNTANIAEYLAKTDSRIRLITQTNKGLSCARNSGIQSAKGEFFQFLDADDMLERNKICAQLEFLRINPGIDIVYSDARYFTTKNTNLRDYGINRNDPWIPNLWLKQGTLLEKLLIENLFPVNSPIVRRKIFDRIGLWNHNLAAHEDWEFWIRCAIGGFKFSFFDGGIESMALIRKHPDSMTNDIQRMQCSQLQMRIHIGNQLYSKRLKKINFVNALELFNKNNNDFLFAILLDLCRANRCINVYLSTVIFFINYFIINNLGKTYHKLTPWPIQKALAKLLNF